MGTNRINLTSPVGRIVQGNLYTPRVTDFDGKPLVIKTGANAGQPRSDYFFALAIPKGQERGWWETEWGKQIYQVGALAFPQACQRPDFAWKIDDGDSQIPNKKGRKPCDTEGWPGHWILKLSGSFAPKVYRQEGSGFVQVTEAEYVKPGYFVQVALNVDGNGNQNNPGVYLNHSMICFSAYGPEIVFGPNVDDAGFGAAPLPAGASLTPLAATVPLPGAPAPVPPAMPGMPAMPAAPVMPALPVTPNPGFLQVPGAPVAPVAASPFPPAPIAPVAVMPVSPSSSPRMTEKAAGSSYEAFRAAGWSDAQLIANGYMLA